MKPKLSGKPIPGTTTRDDAEFALHRARRYIFRWGQYEAWSEGLHAYVDMWLDYLDWLDFVGWLRAQPTYVRATLADHTLARAPQESRAHMGSAIR